MHGAAFYREIKTQIEGKLVEENRRYMYARTRSHCVDLKKELDQLLQNNLVLDQTRCGPGEEGHRLHTFLCANITDQDMPRDTSVIDW